MSWKWVSCRWMARWFNHWRPRKGQCPCASGLHIFSITPKVGEKNQLKYSYMYHKFGMNCRVLLPNCSPRHLLVINYSLPAVQPAHADRQIQTTTHRPPERASTKALSQPTELAANKVRTPRAQIAVAPCRSWCSAASIVALSYLTNISIHDAL